MRTNLPAASSPALQRTFVPLTYTGDNCDSISYPIPRPPNQNREGAKKDNTSSNTLGSLPYIPLGESEFETSHIETEEHFIPSTRQREPAATMSMIDFDREDPKIVRSSHLSPETPKKNLSLPADEIETETNTDTASTQNVNEFTEGRNRETLTHSDQLTTQVSYGESHPVRADDSISKVNKIDRREDENKTEQKQTVQRAEPAGEELDEEDLARENRYNEADHSPDIMLNNATTLGPILKSKTSLSRGLTSTDSDSPQSRDPADPEDSSGNEIESPKSLHLHADKEVPKLPYLSIDDKYFDSDSEKTSPQEAVDENDELDADAEAVESPDARYHCKS